MTKTVFTPKMKIGALGGPQTFGDQACRHFMELYPEFSEVVYLQTADALFDALKDGTVDAGVGPEQMSNTGFHLQQQARVSTPDSAFFIAAEVLHEYHCCLIGKPGATLNQVRKVIGHTGSITQSRAWIDSNLPHAKLEIVHTNSRTAALSILDGDGSVASVATEALADELKLPKLAQNIDNGSVGNYWVYTAKPYFVNQPQRLVVTGRFADQGDQQGQLSRMICALSDVGFVIQTVCSQPTGRRVFEYDYVLRFRGVGNLDEVKSAVVLSPSARLVGAFEPR